MTSKNKNNTPRTTNLSLFIKKITYLINKDSDYFEKLTKKK